MAEANAGGGEIVSLPPGPVQRRLTPEELHAQRVAWGQQWGQVMKDIRRQHEKAGS